MNKGQVVMIGICMLFGGLLVAADNGMNPAGEAFVKAFNANDLEAVVALYAPDAILYPPDSMVAKGKDAIRESYGGLMDHYTIKEIVISDAQHETIGDTSIGWGSFSLTMVPKTGGDVIQMSGRFTDVSKNINGKWLYVVDHASAPLPLSAPPATTPSQ
jgi:uncharacterized protein (TIGR02246 family)